MSERSPEIDCNCDELGAPQGQFLPGTFKVVFRRKCLNCGKEFKAMVVPANENEIDWIEVDEE